MINGVILIGTVLGQVYNVKSTLAAKNHRIIEKMFVSAGPYDLVVVVSAEKVSEIGHLIVSDIQTVEGVSSTLTMLSLDDDT